MTNLKENQEARWRLAPKRPQGGRAAADFEALYRDSRDDLYAYLAFLLGDRSLAEEVTAQAFEKAFSRRSTFDPLRGDLRAWLFRIARNAAIDELRRGKRVSVIDMEDAAEFASPASAEVLAVERVAIETAMKALTPRRRELVALKFYAGLTNIEIARVVGQSESNVGSQLHRAIKQLREVLGE